MTRGKYAARSALRREDAGVQSEIQSYRHAVQRLTSENKRITAYLIEDKAAHKEEVRKLKAMLDEGLTPELLALRDELERQRDRAKSAATARRQTQEKYERLVEFTTTLLHDITGCTGLEAVEAVLAALGGPAQLAGAGTGSDLPLTADEAQTTTLQRTRGYRSSAKVRDNLNAICRQAARRRKTDRAAARRAQ